MRARLLTCLAIVAFLVVPATPLRVGAAPAGQYPYILIDLGTFGGPQAGQGNGPYLSNTGMVGGTADTTVPDPYYPNENSAFNEDPFIQHTYLWQRGNLIDQGSLPGTNSSYTNGINVRGDEAGLSDNGVINPLTQLPEVVAILWRNRQIVNLGTLGGNESAAFALNDWGQVVGVAQNAIPDPLSMLGLGTEARAFLWQDGAMRDLGTLGGPDAFGWFVNDRRQVAGVSYTNAVVNPVTGQPQTDPFLWQNGTMRDLGTLGGSVATFGGVNALNNRGEVAGASDLVGDQIFHPFLWDGRSLKDLGTLGGDYGVATGLNEFGATVGWTTTPGNTTAHAMLWRDGAMTDLGTLPGQPCGFANSINLWGQVVGGSCTADGNGFLWERGSITDLNALVAPSTFHILEAVSINDLGEIVAYGVLPDGNEHNVLLVPARLAGLQGLTSNATAPATVVPVAVPRANVRSCTNVALRQAHLASWRTWLARTYHLPCAGA